MISETLNETLEIIKNSVDTDIYLDLEQYIITTRELIVLELLGKAFNEFRLLNVLHSSDLPEFQKAIHDAQNIILARVGLRQTGITDR